MLDTPLWIWTAFTLFVLAVLALDLGVFHRKSHVVSWREALAWSAVWVALALLFAAGIYRFQGHEPALQFLTGYLIEKSLSVDNLFVFALVFSAFAVPPALQHRVLVWGVVGAIAMRAGLILAGTALLQSFAATLYVFGAFLIFTGIRMARSHYRPGDAAPDVADLEQSFLLRLLRRTASILPDYRGDRLVVHEGGRRRLTPLFLVLVVVESTDLLFAVDSIPAILAITTDPFLVFTSNVFAILGLRSLYFLLAAALTQLVHLKLGLAAILVFVGAKISLADFVHIPPGVSLAVTLGILAVAVATSLWSTRVRENVPA